MLTVATMKFLKPIIELYPPKVEHSDHTIFDQEGKGLPLFSVTRNSEKHDFAQKDLHLSPRAQLGFE
jgi:hypothetical protein